MKSKYGGFFEISNNMSNNDFINSNNSNNNSTNDSSTSTNKAGDKKTESKTDKVKNFVKSNGVIILIVIVLILIVVITIWIISIVRKSKFKVVNLSDTIIRLDRSESMPMTYASSKFPSTNGHEFTFSFWLYLSDYDVLYNHRMLFRRGGSIDSLNFGNPIVALDSKTNKMYIAIKTNQSLDVQSV